MCMELRLRSATIITVKAVVNLDTVAEFSSGFKFN